MKPSAFGISVICRHISTTPAAAGKRNFRKFPVYNKRGTKAFKEAQSRNPHPEIPIDKRGVRDTGVTINGKFVNIPEMIPMLVVPDLKDCKLKPYVSYRTPEIEQGVFTSEDLFYAVYAEKIASDFKEGKLNEDGSPKEPSEEEALTPDQAWARARKTGSDMF